MPLRHALTPLLAALVATAGWAQPSAPATATVAVGAPGHGAPGDHAPGGKVALVLGGGAARGTAHIGVIQIGGNRGVTVFWLVFCKSGKIQVFWRVYLFECLPTCSIAGNHRVSAEYQIAVGVLDAVDVPGFHLVATIGQHGITRREFKWSECG